MEKLTLQMISEKLAATSGLQKKSADALSKMFFDTIVHGLQTDGVVKVNGLGTFKIVEVADRESVNVNNGERIVIPGYKKVGFVPAIEAVKETEDKKEDSVVEAVEMHEDMESADEERQADKNEVADEERLTDNNEVADEERLTDKNESVGDEVETLVHEIPAIEKVEVPENEFSNIDMIISTPESIEDVRQQLEDATRLADETLSAAKAAFKEKVRLEMLLNVLETNAAPEEQDVKTEVAQVASENVSEVKSNIEIGLDVQESGDDEFVQESVEESVVESVDETDTSASGSSEMTKQEEAFIRYVNEKPETEETNKAKKNNSLSWLWWIVVPILLAVITGSGVFVYLRHRIAEADAAEAARKKIEKVEKKKAPVARPVRNDTVKFDSVPTPDLNPSTSIAAKQTKKPEVTKSATKAEVTKSATKPEATKPEATKPVKNTASKTYIFSKGDNLYKVSRKFYGTNDSVRAILRINKFDNPDNIPLGKEIKLP